MTKKPSSIGFVAVFACCSMQTLAQAQATPFDEEVIARIQKIHSSIAAMDAQYSHKQIPTETFVAEYARDRKKPIAEVRAQFTSQLEVRWAWKATGERFLERVRFGEGGKLVDSTTLAFDGVQHTKIQASLDGDIPVSTAEVQGNVLAEYGALATIELVLGFNSRAGKPLLALLAESGKVAPDNEFTNIEATFVAGGSENRLTGRLNATKGFAIIDLRHEAMHEGRLRLLNASHSSEFETAERGGSSVDYWFPLQTEFKTYNSRGDESFTDTLTIHQLRVNPDLAASRFRADIPLGAQVRDHKTGKVWFQSSKASAEVDKVINARVEQAKKQVQSLPPEAVTATAQPPLGSMRLWAIVSAVGGTSFLGVAFWFWLRVKSSTSEGVK